MSLAKPLARKIKLLQSHVLTLSYLKTELKMVAMENWLPLSENF
jgi:hypothetical protein